MTMLARRADPAVTAALIATSVAFGWFIFGSGPIVPRLQAEYGVSRAVASLHSLAMALGTVAGSSAAVAVLRRTRRGGGLSYGLAGMSLGALMICAGPVLGAAGIVLSIAGYLVAGAAGSATSAGVTAMADAMHGERAGRALSTIHGFAAVAGLLAPLAIGAGIALGLTWRAGFLVHLLLAFVAFAVAARVWQHPVMRAGPPPASQSARVPGSNRPVPMPARFWVVLVVVMIGVALEFALAVWSGDLLQRRTPLGVAGATAAVSAVVAGMAVGRLAVPRIVRGLSPRSLMWVGCALVTAGWAMVWAATGGATGSAGLAVAGLLVSGVGIGVFYPIGSGWLVAESLGRPEAAVARLGVAAGVASGVAPFALGAVADAVGVRTAFLLIPAITVVAIACLVLTARAPTPRTGQAGPFPAPAPGGVGYGAHGKGGDPISEGYSDA